MKMAEAHILFMLLVLNIGPVLAGSLLCITSPTTTEVYPHTHTMSADEYILFWKIDSTQV